MLRNYSTKNFNLLFSRIHQELLKLTNIVVWGMASKGIIYSLNADNMAITIDYYVDVNINKQDKYIPKSGKKIISPNNLPTDKKLSIICMNPNYLNEIALECKKLSLNFNLYSAELVKQEIK